jgi:thiamine-phosphate pyrophosphorylase
LYLSGGEIPALTARTEVTPQIYLVTPPVVHPEEFAGSLAAACAAAPVAALLVRLGPAPERERIEACKRLAPVAQAHGVAVLLEDEPNVAARGGADGVHVTLTGEEDGNGALEDAMQRLKPERIVGIGGLRARHDAMDAAEAGVDYVMFGEPRGEDGACPPIAAIAERARWWAELFETPCVAYAPDADAVAELALTGAEFVALGPWVFEAADPGEAVAQAARVLAQAAPQGA